ncbi:MAG: class B sortase [Eubacterium sp.]|nr:class B sortase [Eubacterium sp.]
MDNNIKEPETGLKKEADSASKKIITDLENDLDADIKNTMADDTISASEVNAKIAKKYTEDAKKKKKKDKNKVYNILIAIFAGIFLFSAGYLGLYFYRNYKSEKQYDKLRDMVVEEPDIIDENDIPTDTDEEIVIEKTDENNNPLDKPKVFVYIDGHKVQFKYKDIYRANHDFIGWLKIDGTTIDYPVMLTPDNEEYYLRKDFYGEYSLAGTLFCDTDSNVVKPSDNILIYGHHMKTSTMFHDLMNYEEEDFYQKHKYIVFNTVYGDNKYEIIAAFKTNIKEKDDTSFKYYTFFNAADEEEFNYYVENCKNLTSYDIPTTAQYGDKLLTLSTCSYHTDNGRFVVVAKRIEHN